MTPVSVIRIFTFALALARPAISAPRIGTPAPPAPAQVAVFLQFDHEMPAVAVAQMKSEVFAILRPAGYEFVWLVVNAESEVRDYPDLIFVRFSGNCEASGRPGIGELPRAVTGIPLARTAVSDGKVLPFTEVRCDELRSFLASRMIGQAAGERETTMGRAIGRVLSHEMFHMFVATRDHGHAGVARSSHSANELASEKVFQFEPGEIRLLQEAHHHPTDGLAAELRD